jgi:uncharacterized protein
MYRQSPSGTGMIAIAYNHGVTDQPRITIPMPAIEAFCRRWSVAEFALFGSVLREDFGPESDVDVLVTFAPGAPVSLWDWAAMTDELIAIFGRPVDLVEKPAIRNPLRRRRILDGHRVLLAA